MKINTEVRGGEKLAKKLKEIQDRLTSKKRVLIGLPAGSGVYEDGTPIAVIGATHEFGGEINHPGGTSYGYATEEDARAGNVRFLPSGKGVMQLGVTGPHKIVIPERSFLRVPLRQNVDNIKKGFSSLAGMVSRGEISAFQMLDQMGARAAGYCKEAIETGIAPPNARSTVRRKGSATPLIHTGHLKNAITHVVED
ncbi:hypothetical protein EKN38_13040 [Enterobacter sp. WCHEn045836]|uniref:hypothetical protein n=1 Tax=Enterobacter sp. WCHEn045836 TaxID=2497434 RepID=UPI000F84C3F5|nr:hypothetical protein [Enterobacter sp. WCHEn045836]RTQ01294.1 hypothetical protein EKN38_13040 [Enterobacter sp. WCHEn045836]